MKYFYKQTEQSSRHVLYTVGYKDADGNFFPDSDWNKQEQAAQRAAFLNGNSSAVDPTGTKPEYIAEHASVEDICAWADGIMGALGAPDLQDKVTDEQVAFARRIIETKKQIDKYNVEGVFSNTDNFILKDGTKFRVESVGDCLRIRCDSHGQMIISPVVANVIEIRNQPD